MDAFLSLRDFRYFSRHVVGYVVAPRESSDIAREMFEKTCMRQNVQGSDLVIHSGRGSAMTSKSVALSLADLGITKSLNRPNVSNDNPFSESQFKTLKSRPEFPHRFGSVEDARVFCHHFFIWYNNEHYHSGIALMTPSPVHYGLAEECNRERQKILDAAYFKHPERFVRGLPQTIRLPEAVWINPPASEKLEETTAIISSISIIGGVR